MNSELLAQEPVKEKNLLPQLVNRRVVIRMMHSPSDNLNQKSSNSSDLFSDSNKHEGEEIHDQEENKDQVYNIENIKAYGSAMMDEGEASWSLERDRFKRRPELSAQE